MLAGVGVALGGARFAMRRMKLDAIPDLSDPQVDRVHRMDGPQPDAGRGPGHLPDRREADRRRPDVTDVRGYSMFGMSFVYVVFEEGTDIYWARSRVLEYLSGLRGTPARRRRRRCSAPTPPASAGCSSTRWSTRRGTHGLDELRTFQDFTLRYALGSVPGVAEVASVGGYQKQYQVTVDPDRLRAYGLRSTR